MPAPACAGLRACPAAPACAGTASLTVSSLMANEIGCGVGRRGPGGAVEPAIRAMSTATFRVGCGCSVDDRVNYGTVKMARIDGVWTGVGGRPRWPFVRSGRVGVRRARAVRPGEAHQARVPLRPGPPAGAGGGGLV